MSALAATLTRRRPQAAGQDLPLRPPSGRRDRRTLALVASVALVAASIAGFTSLYASADHKSSVIVLVRAVSEGQAITSADLGEAQVAASGDVDMIPVDQASEISGKRAASSLPAGSLLTLGDLTGAPAIAAGDAVVGVALKDGSFPTSGLVPGDQVQVVQTAAPGSAVAAPSGATAVPSGVAGVSVSGTGETDTGVLVPQATVFAVSSPSAASSGGVTLLVSLEVASSVAASVATASAADQVGLVLLPQGGPTAAAPATGASATAPSATPSSVPEPSASVAP